MHSGSPTDCTTPSASIINSDRARFNELVTQGKEKTRQGDLYGALEHYQKAFKIHKSQKLAQKIEKLKVQLILCNNTSITNDLKSAFRFL